MAESVPPTLRNVLDVSNSWLWVHRAACRCNKAVPLAPFVYSMGLDAPLPAILTRLRCTTCGEHPVTMSLPTSNGVGKPRDRIPMDYVPLPLRDWAKVDLFHIPAPLRGQGLRP